MRKDDFIGQQFYWFMGVVEDRDDPEEMNRVRVRCFGYHTTDAGLLPTDSLPWASVIMPSTSSGTSGIGSSPHGLMNGSWVVGFFRDGTSAQDPIVMGSVASLASEAASPTSGFNDPSEEYPKSEYVSLSDVNKSARTDYYKKTDVYNAKDSERIISKVASPVKITTVAPDKTTEGYYDEKTWTELPVSNDHIPSYPYNKVTESESGHVFEVDDSPGNERIHNYHRSGSFDEIYNDGTRNVKIIGDDYEIVLKNKNMYIRGDLNLTVSGDLKHMIYGNYHLEVEKDFTQNVKGSIQRKVGGNLETEVNRNRATNVGLNDNLAVLNDQVTATTNDKIQTVGNDYIIQTTNDFSQTAYNNLTLYAEKDLQQMNQGALTVTSKGNIVLGTEGNYTETIDGTHDITVALQQTFTAANLDIANNVDITGTSTATVDHVSATISGKGHTHSGSATAATGAVSDTGTPNA